MLQETYVSPLLGTKNRYFEIRDRFPNLQDSEAEDDGQCPLLPPRQLQGPDRRQRKHEEQDVADEVEARHDVPDAQRVETPALDRRVPELRDGDADEREQEAFHDRPRAEEDHAAGCYPLHGLAREDAAVLEEDRDLDVAHGDIVQNDGYVEGLDVVMHHWS